MARPVGRPSSVAPMKITPEVPWPGRSLAKAQIASHTRSLILSDSFRSTWSVSGAVSNASSSSVDLAILMILGCRVILGGRTCTAAPVHELQQQPEAGADERVGQPRGGSGVEGDRSADHLHP